MFPFLSKSDFIKLAEARIISRIYKSVNGNRFTNGTFEDFQFSNRYGDTWIPWLQLVEPLKEECHNFLESVITNKIPKTDGKNGMDVVKVLEAADISLKNNGSIVIVK